MEHPGNYKARGRRVNRLVSYLAFCAVAGAVIGALWFYNTMREQTNQPEIFMFSSPSWYLAGFEGGHRTYGEWVVVAGFSSKEKCLAYRHKVDWRSESFSDLRCLRATPFLVKQWGNGSGRNRIAIDSSIP
jgi:hypothetical protein